MVNVFSCLHNDLRQAGKSTTTETGNRTWQQQALSIYNYHLKAKTVLIFWKSQHVQLLFSMYTFNLRNSRFCSRLILGQQMSAKKAMGPEGILPCGHKILKAIQTQSGHLTSPDNWLFMASNFNRLRHYQRLWLWGLRRDRIQVFGCGLSLQSLTWQCQSLLVYQLKGQVVYFVLFDHFKPPGCWGWFDGRQLGPYC